MFSLGGDMLYKRLASKGEEGIFLQGGIRVFLGNSQRCQHADLLAPLRRSSNRRDEFGTYGVYLRMPQAASSDAIVAGSCSVGTTHSHCSPCPHPWRYTCTRKRIFDLMERATGDACDFGIFDEGTSGYRMGFQMLAEARRWPPATDASVPQRL